MLLSRFVDQELKAYVCAENSADMVILAGLAESGKIMPVVDRTYPLTEAPEAIRYLERGQARGKAAITV